MWRIIYDDGRLPIEERETFLEEYTLKGKTGIKKKKKKKKKKDNI